MPERPSILRTLTHSVLLAVLIAGPLTSVASAATAVGEAVRIELKDGSTVAGRLIAETSNGYLIEVAGQNIVVLFADVAQIDETRVAPPVGPPPTPAELVAAAPIPPRPERSGVGLIIPGWILVGVGGLFTLAGISAGRCGDDSGGSSDCSRGTENIVTFGLLNLAAGGVMAIIGHSKLSESDQRIRDWEEKHGVPAPIRDINNVQLTPLIGRDTQGLGLTLIF